MVKHWSLNASYMWVELGCEAPVVFSTRDNKPVFRQMSDATAPAKKKKKGDVNVYGYNKNGMSRRARCAGLPRVHALTEKVATAILDANVRNALRVAATRAAIAKHHTVQLGYISEGIKLASGVSLLGHRTAGKHWRSAASSRKKKDKKVLAEAK